MSNLLTIKKKITFVINKLPVLKYRLKQFFYFFTYAIYNKTSRQNTTYEILPQYISIKSETFFGYYDKSPVNQKNSDIIFHESIRPTYKKPISKDPINVVIKSLVEPEKYIRLTTSAYNWQQGARAQWIDNERIIFNDYNYKEDYYYSKIANSVSGKIEKIVDFPIYDVYQNIGFSLNFDRLAIMRPDYGYRNRIERNMTININNYDNDGIFKVDIQNNSRKLIISFDRLCDFEPNENLKSATHKVNHIMISPDGENIIFLHRYFVKGRKFDRLFLYNNDTNTLKLLSDHEMISHCFWYDSKYIVSYMRDFTYGDKYYIIDIENQSRQVLGNQLIDNFGDGHPNIFQDKMIFDTYPNKYEMKELFKYDIKNSKLEKLGELFTPFKYYGESRCDLHPRWSSDGSKIFFDSIHTGYRRLYMMEMNRDLKMI